MSLNAENMADLFVNDAMDDVANMSYWRSLMLADLIRTIDPDIVGVVEAPARHEQTEHFVKERLGDEYQVVQGERRGLLGLAFLLRRSLQLTCELRTKAQSLKDFQLGEFDADGDGIREVYSWANRVPFEVRLAGPPLSADVSLILVHAKSKGAFIPGDLFAYERLSRANRMKQRAQAWALRRRIEELVDATGAGRLVVMGDMNDGPEFDKHSALLGGSFLEPLMGSVWEPRRVLHNPHRVVVDRERWTIDFQDRIVNPLVGPSRYGTPSEMRSWIDHILLSPELCDDVVPASAGIWHQRVPAPAGMPVRFRGLRPTDHKPPYVTVQL
ncbi:MAG TPA: endonuclease/exonuclease/phosphatase family protein [Pilimelia sp.]|nr:endonuclease/exonuclease/phosphatase family protein [Pilimelia sp.]